MPLTISVITPSFNQAQFLPKNLESVREQAYTNVEHIVVDPGSTDNSLEIARQAEGIELIAEPDRGQSDGICKGFLRSTGDILTWLNSDDYYPNPEVLERVASVFSENPSVDVVYGNVTFVDEDGKELRKGFVNRETNNLLSSFQYQVGIVQPGVFIRRRVFEAIGGPSEQYEYCMDYEFWVRIASHGYRWRFVDDLFALHRWWGGMKTSKGRDLSLIEHMRVCDEYFGYIHWKWLDRYAEYLVSKMDGVVNHSSSVDQEKKSAALKSVIRRFVSQKMFNMLSISDEPNHIETYDFILKSDPKFRQYFQDADQIDGLLETCNSPGADKHRAWHVFHGQSRDGRKFRSYKVPNNFHRCFDSQWYDHAITYGQAALNEFARSKKNPTCVIVANGPSLNKSDLSLLKGADVIISNFATLNKELLEYASFLTVTNTLVAEQGAVAFNSMKTTKVLPFWLAHQINPTPETWFVNATVKPEFCTRIGDDFSWRSTVSFFNMQLAYVLGYQKVVLIGFDHSYIQPPSVVEGDEIRQSDDDQNHFDPRYFKGKTWQAADTDKMEEMYRLAKAAFDEAGREIVNCTVGGQLEVFGRGDLETELAIASDERVVETQIDQIDHHGSDLSRNEKRLLPDILESPSALLARDTSVQRETSYARRTNSLSANQLKVHKEKLQSLKASRRSDRCFIIGNGSSLSDEDLSLLEGEDTFVVDDFFSRAKELPWSPTYYVIEDHAIAEKFASELNGLDGPKKLFPSYLAYCLNENKDVIYLNHRPNPRFPNGFSFSKDASNLTYTGFHPLYMCIQIAYYLGYKEIYLLGADDKNISNQDNSKFTEYSSHEFYSQFDKTRQPKPTHFDKTDSWLHHNSPHLFGAYAEAKRAIESEDCDIVNATAGGELEVFPRRSLSEILAPNAQKTLVEDSSIEDFPRVLVIDHTAIGNGTATGELKKNIFGAWPAEKYRQLAMLSTFGPSLITKDGTVLQRNIREINNLNSVLSEFQPNIVLYRMVPDTLLLHSLAMSYIDQHSDIPVSVWIMDDWPARLKDEDANQFARIDPDWRRLLKRSSLRMSIGTKMSELMQQRYGLDFRPFANGVNRLDWPAVERAPNEQFVLRYAGALADNMTASSIFRVARAVDKLAQKGLNVKMEIQTKQIWKDQQSEKFSGLKCTTINTEQLSTEKYRRWLSQAGAVLIAYNFDEASLAYIGSSVANKMPECLASGAPLLVHGPLSSATVAYLNELHCSIIVPEPSEDALMQAIVEMVERPQEMSVMAENARKHAFQKHNIFKIQKQFCKSIIATLAKMPNGSDARIKSMKSLEFSRSDKAHIDETKAVAELLKSRTGSQHLMLDVGAHFGTSAQYFDQLGWTVHCFEPDPSNRDKLTQRFAGNQRVRIDPRALSDKPAKNAQFYKSDQSTGISGLHAFHDTHEKSGLVDITTIEKVVKIRGIHKIDFLKIDVEGFDLNVLKGVPWDDVRPDVIECEFEDAKTLPLGHNWVHLARFLKDKGYAVYVSEWHPIVRYGVAHDWRRVFGFPSFDLDSNSWGNLLAFKNDPGIEAVEAAFMAVMTFPDENKETRPLPSIAGKNQKTITPDVDVQNDQERIGEMLKVPIETAITRSNGSHNAINPVFYHKTLYSRVVHRVKNHSENAFSALRFLKRAAVHVFTRRLLAVPILVTLLLTAWFVFDNRFQAARPWLLVSLFGVLLMTLTSYIAFRSHRHIELLQENNALLGKNVVAQAEEIRELRKQVQNTKILIKSEAEQSAHTHAQITIETSVKPQIEATSHSLSKLATQLVSTTALFGQRLDEQLEQLSGQQEALNTQASALKEQETFTLTLAQDVEALSPMLEDIISSKLNELRQDYDASSKSQIAEIGRVSEKAEKFETELKEVIERHKETAQWSSYDNSVWYQHFNRKLTSKHIDLFKGEWEKKLSIPITKQRLGYMATRACDLERMLDGRLATSIEDILLRTLVAKSVKSPNLEVLEIGTLFATGSAIMFDALSSDFEQTHFSLLDPLDGYYNRVNADLLTGKTVDEQTVLRNLKRAGLDAQNFELIRHLSTDPEAQEAVKDRKFDVLIIDGDHSYAGIKTDFENYAHTVKLGGYIIIDDYGSPDWPDVKEYVDQELTKNSSIARVGATWRTCVYRVVKTE